MLIGKNPLVNSLLLVIIKEIFSCLIINLNYFQNNLRLFLERPNLENNPTGFKTSNFHQMESMWHLVLMGVPLILKFTTFKTIILFRNQRKLHHYSLLRCFLLIGASHQTSSQESPLHINFNLQICKKWYQLQVLRTFNGLHGQVNLDTK